MKVPVLWLALAKNEEVFFYREISKACLKRRSPSSFLPHLFDFKRSFRDSRAVLLLAGLIIAHTAYTL